MAPLVWGGGFFFFFFFVFLKKLNKRVFCGRGLSGARDHILSGSAFGQDGIKGPFKRRGKGAIKLGLTPLRPPTLKPGPPRISGPEKFNGFRGPPQDSSVRVARAPPFKFPALPRSSPHAPGGFLPPSLRAEQTGALAPPF